MIPIEYDVDDLHSMALCVWKEARGQFQIGMRSVAHVIKNRVGAVGFPKTLHDVIYQKNAFSSMSLASDPEFNLIPPPGDLQFNYCLCTCPLILSGDDEDPTYGAKFYYNPNTARSPWFVKHIAGPDGNGTDGHSLSAVTSSQKFYL